MSTPLSEEKIKQDPIYFQTYLGVAVTIVLSYCLYLSTVGITNLEVGFEPFSAIATKTSGYVGLNAILQLSLVVVFVITWVPVMTIIRKTNRNLKDISLIVVMIIFSVWFMISLRKVYPPAVLLMALIAIILAVEHLGTLHEAEESLENVKVDVKDMIQRGKQYESGHVWRRVMYNTIIQSKDANIVVMGIVKQWDIDKEFFEAVKDIGGGKELSHDCNEFVNQVNTIYEKYEKSDGDTLFRVLNSLQVQTIKTLDSSGCEGAFPYVRYLYDPSLVQNNPELEGEYAKANLIGLMWQVEQMHRINSEILKHAKQYAVGNEQRLTAERLSKLEIARVRVGVSTGWIHVIGDDVYEVYSAGGGSRVRLVTDPIVQTDNSDQVRQEVPRIARDSVKRQMGGTGRAKVYIAKRLKEIENDAGDFQSGNKYIFSAVSLAMAYFKDLIGDTVKLTDTDIMNLARVVQYRYCQTVGSKFDEEMLK